MRRLPGRIGWALVTLLVTYMLMVAAIGVVAGG